LEQTILKFEKTADKKRIFGAEKTAALNTNPQYSSLSHVWTLKAILLTLPAAFHYELIDGRLRIVLVAKSVETTCRQASFTKAILFV